MTCKHGMLWCSVCDGKSEVLDLGECVVDETTQLKTEIDRLRDCFIRSYAGNSDVTPERLAELGQVAIPCDCDEPTCLGWQMVSKEAAARAVRDADGEPLA